MLIRVALVLIAAYWTGYWVAGFAVAVLFLIWGLLARWEGPPVLALALTYQWMQVTIGIFYNAVTGAPLEAMVETDWQPMVILGLIWVSCLTIAIYVGVEWMRTRVEVPQDAPARAFPMTILYAAYGASLLLTGAIQELAWDYPAFTQAILAVTFSHLALVFLLVRRLARPRLQWEKLLALMAIEIGLGFTGYFAGFREPLTMCAIALFEIFDRHDARHWVLAAVLLVLLGSSSLVWLSVRGQLRQDLDDEIASSSRIERFDHARTLSLGLLNGSSSDYADTATKLVNRLWTIEYPAMALERVPLAVPHSDGQIMQDALTHLVTPRFLYPDKPDLISDSELVRKYAGANVAGQEQNTSIAFGYLAESYVDYGIPLMFVPVIIFGLLIGALYQVWLSIIHHRDLAVGLVTVVFWMSLYQFERSWAKTLGLSVTLMVYLGGLTYLIDQWLMMRRAQQLTSGVSVVDSTS